MAKSTVESLSEVVVDLTEKAPMRVLHVDDEAGFLRAAKQCLEMEGSFQVEIALSVEEAMEKMKKKEFDVIVSDYVMPEKDGLDFLKNLREKGNNIPFIIFTGKGREEIAIKALNLGADQYLNKAGYPEAVYAELAHGIRRAVERKRAYMELWHREERLRAILASSPDAIVIHDLHGKIIDCNEAALKLGGFSSKEELIGKSGFELIAEKDRERALENLKRTLKQGTTKNREYTLLTKDGEEYQGELSASIIKDSIGDPTGFITVLRDVTERKKAEETRKKLLHDLGERVKELHCLYGISKLVEKRDVPLEEKLQGTANLLLPAWQYPHITCARILFEGQEFKTKNFKETRWKQQADIKVYGKKAGTVEVYYLEEKPTIAEGPFLKEERHLIDAVAERIGAIIDRKRAEKELGKAEERFKTMMEEAPICICNTDLKGKITYVNKRLEEALGYSREEIVGKSGFKLVSDETLKLFRKRMKERLMGKPSRLQEGRFRRKDGKWLWAEHEARVIKRLGVPVGFQLIARDITERKRAEKELTETLEKLETMNEKLGVVGKLTRHDNRSKLSTVTNNIYLAKKRLAHDHKTLGYLSEVESAVRQIERIFDFARTYERLGMEELVYMGVAKSFEEALMLFSDLRGVKVVNDCHGLTVLADSLLRQFFYNLIDNSLKHGEKVSQIRVYYEEARKDKLKLVYEDNGVGIPKAEKEKIFMEGYGKGTGYGLYLIKKMCEVYGWTIRESGKQGRGAQFTITISKKGGNEKRHVAA